MDKKHRLIYKFISVFLILVILLLMSLNSFFVPKVDAIVGEGAVLTIGGVTLLATIFVACGIILSGNADDLYSACDQAYRQCSQFTKDSINAILYEYEASGFADMTYNAWESLKDSILGLFPGAVEGMTHLTPFGDAFVVEPGAGWNLSQVSFMETNLPQVVANYQKVRCKVVFNLDIQPTLSTYNITLPTGIHIWSTNTSYGANTETMGHEIINWCNPVILKNNSTGSCAYFKYTMPIDQGLQHWVHFDGIWWVNGTGTAADGYPLIYANNHVTANGIILGDFCTSLANWQYNLCNTLGTIDYAVDTEFFPGGDKEIFADPTYGITISPPQSITDVLNGTDTRDIVPPIAIPGDVAIPITAPPIAIDIDIPDTITLDENVNNFKAPTLILQKFPFCIPFDIYTAFTVMYHQPVAPVFVLPIVFPAYGIDESITIDFADFEVLARIVRWFLSAIFVIGLIMVTRKLIKG